jgi:2-amino-4-hydroxy-6-hydroxymethyldihydropteridine diphosphokinase
LSTITRDVFVGLGSNLDRPARQIETAFELLQNVPESELTQRSSLYRSSPLGGIEQPDFVNAVAAMSTTLAAREFLEELQAIERLRGREDSHIRWGPRILDLDLLLYGDLTIHEPGLSVPHPGIAVRNFVLLPLREIAPECEIPGLGRVQDIAVNEDEPRISRIA